jgi:chromosome partitioning protein
MASTHLLTLAVCNQKGGVGKTTTAINLASCLGVCGNRVLVVDLDAQGNATSGLGGPRSASGGTSAFLTGEDPAKAVFPTSARNVAVMPGGAGLQHVERVLSRNPDGNSVLRSRLPALPEEYDCVILDCPPSTGILTRNAIVASSVTLVPIQCEYFAMEGLTQMLALVEHEQEMRNPSLKVEGILLTMYDGSIELNNEVSHEVRSHFPEITYNTIIPRDIVLSEASSHGVPVLTYSPRSRASLAYVELTREVLHCGKETR